MFRIIDKLFAALVFMPPMYMLFRFLRWYIKQEMEPQKTDLDDNSEAQSSQS
jgi:hypothetical protein